MSYQAKFEAALGMPPPQQHLWCNATFEYLSEESNLILEAMDQVEKLCWRKMLTEIKDTNIPGVICEFGVADGNALWHLVGACEEVGLCRPVYGFDSFEGLPELSEFDADCWKKGDYAADFAEVSRELDTANRPYLHLVKGWFKDSLAKPEILAVDRVCFARVDCDLYESTADALRWLTGRLADRAILCFDDWIPMENIGEAKAFFEWAEQVRDRYSFEFLFLISMGHLYLRVHERG